MFDLPPECSLLEQTLGDDFKNFQHLFYPDGSSGVSARCRWCPPGNAVNVWVSSKSHLALIDDLKRHIEKAHPKRLATPSETIRAGVPDS